MPKNAHSPRNPPPEIHASAPESARHFAPIAPKPCIIEQMTCAPSLIHTRSE
ncbi:hypothetical protein [Helicobacter sp.]|uniref:hypothetical protein n=1 Tax=Helicobacter sp. TaxID=218 RepID=UPI00388FB646